MALRNFYLVTAKGFTVRLSLALPLYPWLRLASASRTGEAA